MGPAGSEHHRAARGQALEPGIAIDLQDARKAAEVRRRSLSLAIRAVEVYSRRRLWTGPRPIVARIGPQPACLGPTTAGVEHRDRRIVGEELGGGEDVCREPGMQWLQPPAGAADPVRQCRTVELDAVASEDPGLTIERHVIAVLADQNLCNEAGRRHAFGDEALGRSDLVDRAAGAAPVFRPTNADDAQRGRHPVEHLAGRLADRMKGATTTGACSGVKIELYLLARQVLGESQAPRPVLAIGFVGRGRRSLASLGMSDIGVEVLKTKLQLIRFEPL